jgi:3-methyladenine DNA glycosylase AlkD
MGQKQKRLFLGEIRSHKNEDLAKHLSRFFKTGKGQYGYGDKFWGLPVALQRSIVKKHFESLSLEDVAQLISNPVHEVRLSCLLVLIEKLKKASEKEKGKIVSLYLSNADNINNWDLVDLSAPTIAGEFWFNGSTKTMFEFAASNHLWKERIAIVANFYFIKRKRFTEILKLARQFLTHEHDLIHKATGWMLREVGKQDGQVLRDFLDKYYKRMPRVMLRYAIEKFGEKDRKGYLKI